MEEKNSAGMPTRFMGSRWEEKHSMLGFALASDPRAQRLADDLAGRFPDDTVVQFNFLPAIRATCEQSFAEIAQ
ncbi:MAG TPA: hypothetical protein VKT75_15250 [Acidobacteriaceae bacterium]|nr:hypothetical protein [Acidobacteriaceae bacterium]